MSSIRSNLLVLAASLFAAAGCSTEQRYAPSPVNQAPIIGDQAIALRSDWPKSVSHYANGDTPAFSTRFPYDVNAPKPSRGDALLEPVMFIAQMAFLPFELVVYPPFKEQIWHGEELGPTYTAQPPMPPLGGVVVPPIAPFPFLGRQANTPDTGLPGAPSAPAAGPGEPQLPAYPAVSIPSSPAPTPPPFTPGSTGGPPAAR